MFVAKTVVATITLKCIIEIETILIIVTITLFCFASPAMLKNISTMGSLKSLGLFFLLANTADAHLVIALYVARNLYLVIIELDAAPVNVPLN